MITIFNRKELITTFSMDMQSNVRDVLSSNGVEYYVKTINRMSPSPMSANPRARTGGFGQSAGLSYEYRIYVKKQDYDKAVYLINKR